MNTETNRTPHVKVMSNDWAAMNRWAEICTLPPKQRVVEFVKWEAEQIAAARQRQEQPA